MGVGSYRKNKVSLSQNKQWTSICDSAQIEHNRFFVSFYIENMSGEKQNIQDTVFFI